jgi:hypothetical protein
MRCYVCATNNQDEQAVALCFSCSAGLCLRHLREAAAFARPGPGYTCPHDPWRRAHTKASLELRATSP